MCRYKLGFGCPTIFHSQQSAKKEPHMRVLAEQKMFWMENFGD